MAAAAELTLLEKSLGLSKGNKYSAQGERQVRSAGGAERKSWPGAGPAEPGGRAGRRRRRREEAALSSHVSAPRGWLAPGVSSCSPRSRNGRGTAPCGLGPDSAFG